MTNWIEAGFKDSPPQSGIYKYIMPLLHLSWRAALQQLQPESRNLKELTDAIEQEAKRNDPKHFRRVKILQLKRGSDSHSDFAERLRQEGSVIEFDKISLDEFLIHLFARDSDSQMSKMALELLEKDKPSFQTLINKCKEIEASVWYHRRKEFSRMASARPLKYCKPCDSKTHYKSEC